MDMQPRIDRKAGSGDIGKLLGRIGNTPLKAISLIVGGVPHVIHLKLEGENPGGSIKDRTGHAILQDMERKGILQSDSIVIESTSGNLGIALAMICRAKGYRFLAVVDPKTTRENIIMMEELGAEIDMVHHPDSNGGYLLSRLERVNELCNSSGSYVWTDQYSNPANPLAHYSGTGPEVYRQMYGKVDVVFVAVSTGGTLSGIGRYFREVSPATRIVGVDAVGSVVFGGRPSPRELTGIGSSRRSSFISDSLYDEHFLVRDEEAFAFCRALFDTTGVKVGGSSGAVLAACARYLEVCPQAARIVCICGDRGENYESSIFNNDWLREQGLNVSWANLGAVEDIALAAPAEYVAAAD